MPAAALQCVALPPVAYVLLDERGELTVDHAPGDAVVHGGELWEQPALREHLRAKMGAGLDVFGHAPGLVAVCGDFPQAFDRPNRFGRAVLEALGGCSGTALFRELWGPLALLAVRPRELVTGGLTVGEIQQVRALRARVIAEGTGLW